MVSETRTDTNAYMTSPSYKELEDRISECMLVDRFRMRRDLKKKKERVNLGKAIAKSSQLARERAARKPELFTSASFQTR